MEGVVSKNVIRQQDRQQLQERREPGEGCRQGQIVEVLFYPKLPSAETFATFGFWPTLVVTLGSLGTMERHCCLRVGGLQYHCVPVKGCFVISNSIAERIMPCRWRVEVVPRHLATWYTGQKFELFRSLLWRWHLLPLQDSAMNCLTATCGMLGFPNLARTTHGLRLALTKDSPWCPSKPSCPS